LADEDPQVRIATLEAMLSGEGEGLSPRSAAEVAKLIENLEVAAEPDVVADAGDSDPNSQLPAPSPVRSSDAVDHNKTPRGAGPQAPTGMVAEAIDAYHSGQFDEAARLFHRALEHDMNNVDALVGLHRISYDRAQYRDARRYVEGAARLRPKRADLQLFAGDSCMRLLDYACARTRYERAKQLGAPEAMERLGALDDRGGPEGK
jgi:tetratricopeptide (TPR) repeat protein